MDLSVRRVVAVKPAGLDFAGPLASLPCALGVLASLREALGSGSSRSGVRHRHWPGSPCRTTVPGILFFLLGAAAVSSLWAGEVACSADLEARMFHPERRLSGEGRPQRQLSIAFPLTLAIALEENQDEVRVTGTGPFTLRSAERSHDAPAGQVWNVTVLSSTPARFRHHVVVSTLEWDDRSEAERLVARWKGEGHPARLIESGARILEGDRVLHDNRRLLVSVRSFRESTAAEAFRDELADRGERPFLFDRIVQLPRGVLRAEAAGGKAALEGETIRFESQRPLRVFQVEHGVGQRWHGRQDREYWGSLELRLDRSGRLLVINHVEIERYLKGVVPAEISPSAPGAAQRAQAVASRGETFSKIAVRHPGEPYDYTATVQDQVYGGRTLETPSTNAAVDATRGQVLRSGDHIVEAVFSANCGGHTEDNDVVWASPPRSSLRGRADAPASEETPSPITEEEVEDFILDPPRSYCWVEGWGNRYRWKRHFTVEEVSALVADLGVGRVTGLIPLGRGVSGRLRALRVVGEDGEAVIHKELPIRRKLGRLRSALFVVKPITGEGGRLEGFELAGAGWGHGVGLCQMGARGMARAGKGHQEILEHYYAGTHIDDLY